MRKNFPILLGLLWAMLTGAEARAASVGPYLLLDPTALAAYKAACLAHRPPEAAQMKAALAAADHALSRGPYTVTAKPQVPPSGDKHDYLSQAPYWWPDPTKPGGKPYIQKDGLKNPESSNLKDDEALTNLCKSVQELAVGYYFSGNEKYAFRAAELLRVFFLNPATRMNPNLNYGQGIPGTVDGRSFGIIETRHLVDIPDALALMGGSKSLRPEVVAGVKKWYGQYTDWLTTSKIGQEEGSNKNNHGTFHDVQVVDFALFIGNKALAIQTLEAHTLPRIPMQFAADGAQPLELARTRPWNYVSMNLQGWVQLAILAQHVDVDLWHYTAPDGKGLGQAVAWFRPYLLHEKAMERPDAVPSGNATILMLYNRVGPQYPSLETEKIFAQYPEFVRTPWAI